jgi:dTDP-4-amino-4,6-dideoxygalactose transaminase
VTRREVPFARVVVSEDDVAAVVETLRSGWLTTGSRSAELEGLFCRLSGVNHALALSSATAALHLALLGWRVGPGDEVILPAMTFSSCVAVVLEAGAKPVLVDVDADDLTIDPHAVEKALTRRTKVVMAVHYAGQPVRMGIMRELTGAHRVKLLEDAAHAPGASYCGKPVGSLGDGCAFSLYANKNVTSGEGGVLTSDDEALIERARMLALHGMSRDAWRRYSRAGSWRYEVVERGYKYNLSDLLAALGASQVARLPALNAARARVAGLYRRYLEGVEEVAPLLLRPEVEHAWHLYVVRLLPERLRISRDEFIEQLREQGVGTSVHFIPVHHHPAFAGLDLPRGGLPATDAAYEQVVSLPIYPDLADEEVEYVCAAIRRIVKQHRR